MTPNVPDGTVAAVDVGGTGVKGALVDRRGAIVAEVRTPTPAGGDRAVAAVRDTIARLVDGVPDVRAVGVAVPGDVDDEVARYAANLGWQDVPARAFTESVLDTSVPVVLDHDVRCAALADRVLGATRDADDACVVVVGTGVASVTLSGGRPVRGARGLAGEVGHIPVHPGGEQCACGQRGCLETYASAGAIARRYRALSGAESTTDRIVATASADPAADPVATRVWADAIEALALGCVTMTMLTDPEVISFAGGLSEAGEALLGPLTDAVTGLLTWREPPRLALSPLRSAAGRYGVALRAWERAGVHVTAGDWPQVISR